MKIIIAFVIFCLACTCVSAQNYQFSVGANKNEFSCWDKHNEFNDFYASPAKGFSAELSFGDLTKSMIKPRFSLLIDNFNGQFHSSGGGATVDVKKTTMGLGFYPLNFLILKHISFSLGAEVGFALHSEGVDSLYVWSSPSPFYTNENDFTSNKNFHAGFSSRIGFEFKIADNWYIQPLYKFYLGLSNKFNVPTSVKSIRQSLQIGIKRNFKY